MSGRQRNLEAPTSYIDRPGMVSVILEEDSVWFGLKASLQDSSSYILTVWKGCWKWIRLCRNGIWFTQTAKTEIKVVKFAKPFQFPFKLVN